MYYEILIYEKDAPGTNQTYKTSNGDAQTYTAEDNLYPGILYIALVRGVANDSDQFEHEGVWSTQQLFSVNGKSNIFFFIHLSGFGSLKRISQLHFSTHFVYCQYKKSAKFKMKFSRVRYKNDVHISAAIDM